MLLTEHKVILIMGGLIVALIYVICALIGAITGFIVCKNFGWG